MTPPAVESSRQTQERADARAGLLYGIAAYGWWGLSPVYFKALTHVNPLEVLSHRIVWSVMFLTLLMRLLRRWPVALAMLRTPRQRLALVFTTIVIAMNWLGFIWAVFNDLVLQASLGYFITPLVNVVLGCLILRERLRPWQTISTLLAGGGVFYLTVIGDEFPWLALMLAVSFGIYGLLRKWAKIDALAGLLVETCALAPLAIGFLMWHGARGEMVFGRGSTLTTVLLAAGGIITAMPLLWFGLAAARLRLVTVGFLQYIAPTGHFLLAVMAYGETFTFNHLISFGLIWTALSLYTFDSFRAGVAARRLARDATPAADAQGVTGS